MKKILFLLSMSAIAVACGSNSLRVTVENPSAFDRSQEIVELPLTALAVAVPLSDAYAYVVKNTAGEFIPVQVTSEGKLIFQAGTAAGQTAEYQITTVKVEDVPNYKAKAYGRFFPERLDDYIWENDRVAFRVYGPALEGNDGPSNGIDAWYKRTEELIVNKWIKALVEEKVSYHKDHGEGHDDYKVGRSLGAGAMSPYVGGKLWLNNNFVSYKDLDNGPLRFAVEFVYNDLNVDGKNITETRTISLDAGSQYNKVVQRFGTEEPMDVAAGISKRENSDYIASDDYVIYTNVEGAEAGEVYMGLVFPGEIKYAKIDSYTVDQGRNKGDYSHVLAVADYLVGQPFTYYTGFGWHKFGFPTVVDFKQYTENFATALKEPLVVNYDVK